MYGIPYDFTDKQISAWGGLRLVQEMLKRIQFSEKLQRIGLPLKGSNRGYDSASLVEGFIVSVILGAKRLVHSGTIGNDAVIKRVFGWKRGMGSQSTFSRFFNRFSLEDNDRIMRVFNQEWFSNIGLDRHTIDIDSSVITRFGAQEGVAVGYNPKKHGRGSHHPIIAFSAEAKMVVQAWMRSGNSTSATQFDEFMDEVLHVIPKEKIGLIRADSGFFGGKNLDYLEEKGLNYVIACKMNIALRQHIFDCGGWSRLKNGVSVATFGYQAATWEKPRRIVVVRKDGNQLPKSGGKTLFPEYEAFEQYRYSAFVTNLDLSGAMVWTIYKKRAEAENQIKELKYAYGLDGFCAQSLAATEIAFRWVMVAYNLMSLFKQNVMKGKNFPSLSTVRFKCIALGSYMVSRGRRTTLKLAARGSKRDYIEQLFVNLSAFSHRLE